MDIRCHIAGLWLVVRLPNTQETVKFVSFKDFKAELDGAQALNRVEVAW